MFPGNVAAFPAEKLGDMVVGKTKRMEVGAAKESASCEPEQSANKTR